MKRQLFYSYQYQDNTLWTDTVTHMWSGIGLYGARMATPGTVNPSDATFTPSNLTVSCALPSPFACLFQTGTLAEAHGTTDGSDTSTYNVDFSSLVPASGNSVTAYCVAQLTTVKQDPFLLVGPPPGHPDYDPSFVPYKAYNTELDTLNVTATTTAPDNQTTIELFRVTLAPGQTTIGSVDTTHQVKASSNAFNIPNSSLAGPQVTTFNTRSGAVTLKSSDVTTALGYTPFSSGGGTINGNVTITGTLNHTSDSRIKSNITNLSVGLSEVKKLRPVEYDHDITKKHEYGLVAQEVEKVLAKAVNKPAYPTNLYSLNYHSLIAVLVKAVQELSDRVEELEEKFD